MERDTSQMRLCKPISDMSCAAATSSRLPGSKREMVRIRRLVLLLVTAACFMASPVSGSQLESGRHAADHFHPDYWGQVKEPRPKAPGEVRLDARDQSQGQPRLSFLANAVPVRCAGRVFRQFKVDVLVLDRNSSRRFRGFRSHENGVGTKTTELIQAKFSRSYRRVSGTLRIELEHRDQPLTPSQPECLSDRKLRWSAHLRAGSDQVIGRVGRRVAE